MPETRAAAWPALALTRRTLLAATTALVAGGARPARARAAPGPAVARDPALHVLGRLANGPAPGDLDRVRRQGVDAWIDAQLAPARLPQPEALQARLAGLSTYGQSPRALVREYRRLEQDVRREPPTAEAESAGGAPIANRMADPMADRSPAREARHAFVTTLATETAQARIARAVASPSRVEESMVDFWMDHFNVFEGKGLVKVLAGAYERDAVRPHALGRFRDLLGATAKHPAMLFYLDNWLSVAPGWQPRANARNAPRGLNENYARELMELHTLGVDGGYTQADVTQLARMLTGWTFVPSPHAEADGLFVFDAARHDAGTKTWLGQAIPPAGRAEGEHALDVLAAHPATARHLATKLARRFVADQPPPAMVDHVAAVFLDTGGDLRAVMRALLFHPAFREAAGGPPQYRTPWEFVVSALRASGVTDPAPRAVMTALSQLGQPLYGCPTPDGWPHAQAAWLNPEGVTRRIQVATAIAAGRFSEPAAPVDPEALLATLGPTLSPATRQVVAGAPGELRAALALGSPDFMHR